MSKTSGIVLKHIMKPCRPTYEELQGYIENIQYAIDAIFNCRTSRLSYEELYRYCYNLVCNKSQKELCNGIDLKIEENIDNIMVLLNEIPEPDMFLETFACEWKRILHVFSILSGITLYYDKNYAIPHKKPTIMSRCIHVYRHELEKHNNILSRLRDAVFDRISRHRLNESVDLNVIKVILEMYRKIDDKSGQVFETEFETPLFNATCSYFQSECLSVLASNSITDSIHQISLMINLESVRCKEYYNSCEKMIQNLICSEIVDKYSKRVICMEGSGLDYLIDENQIGDISSVFQIFSRTPNSLDLLFRTFRHYVIRHGDILVKKLMNLELDDIQFCKSAVFLIEKIQTIVKNSLDGHPRGRDETNAAVGAFLNQHPTINASIASYFDHIIRMVSKEDNVCETNDRTIDSGFLLFKFLSDKDIFEDHYRICLSKRLLDGKSHVDDTEKVILAQLQALCGFQYTRKLEGMITDLLLSKSINDEFARSEFAISSNNAGYVMESLVLTAGFWPFSDSVICRYPSQISSAFDAFSSFYHSKYDGRRLRWLFQQGRALLKVRFGSCVRDISMSTYQMCICMMYNLGDCWTMEEIENYTQIPEGELRLHLLGLSSPKFPILTRIENQNESLSQYKFNSSFSPKVKKFSIGPAIKKSKGTVETSQMSHLVEQSRINQIDAAVVRIMKARRTMRYNDLYSEVVRQLSSTFMPEVTIVKKRLESLMDRDYICRDEGNSAIFHYVA